MKDEHELKVKDEHELKVIALRSAIDLALSLQSATTTEKKAEGIVKDAKTMYDFLIDEKDEDENTGQ